MWCALKDDYIYYFTKENVRLVPVESDIHPGVGLARIDLLEELQSF